MDAAGVSVDMQALHDQVVSTIIIYGVPRLESDTRRRRIATRVLVRMDRDLLPYSGFTRRMRPEHP